MGESVRFGFALSQPSSSRTSTERRKERTRGGGGWPRRKSINRVRPAREGTSCRVHRPSPWKSPWAVPSSARPGRHESAGPPWPKTAIAGRSPRGTDGTPNEIGRLASRCERTRGSGAGRRSIRPIGLRRTLWRRLRASGSGPPPTGSVGVELCGSCSVRAGGLRWFRLDPGEETHGGGESAVLMASRPLPPNWHSTRAS